MKGVDRLVGDARERHPRPMDARERTVVWALSIAYAGTASAVAFAVPWNRHPSVWVLAALVLLDAGATRPKRDPVDERIVGEVLSGKVTYEEGKGIITDINQVGALVLHVDRPRFGCAGIEIPSAIGERVWGNVEDAHHERALT